MIRWDLPPNDSRSFVHKRLFGAAKSFVTSGFSPTAAATGFITGGGSKQQPRQFPRSTFRTGLQTRAPISARTRAPSSAPRPVTRLADAARSGRRTAPPRPVTRLAATGIIHTHAGGFRHPHARPLALAGCGPGFEMRNGRCVRKGGLIPSAERLLGITFGGKPPRERTTTMARRRDFGQAVVGAFGMPAMVPEEESRVQLVCPRGMVLGTDNLCYPKGVLSSRNLHRKWRRPPRAPVTAADARHIRKAAAAKDRVLRLAKDVGLHASKTRPSTKSKKGHQHLIAAPAQHLQVISEETN